MGARRSIVALLALASACAPQAEEPPPDQDYVAVAQHLCPMMWDWQLDIGGIMNAMSAASRAAPDDFTRLALYRDSFSQARQRIEDLDMSLTTLPSGPFVDPLREDIRNGLFVAEQIITEIDADVDALHDIGTTGYHDVVPRIFLGFEKVIDVAKPEMAAYGNPELMRAFISVPQCQHGVKDANDGLPRFVARI